MERTEVLTKAKKKKRKASNIRSYCSNSFCLLFSWLQMPNEKMKVTLTLTNYFQNKVKYLVSFIHSDFPEELSAKGIKGVNNGHISLLLPLPYVEFIICQIMFFLAFFGSESCLVSTASGVNGKILQDPSFPSSMGYGTILWYRKVWVSWTEGATRFPSLWTMKCYTKVWHCCYTCGSQKPFLNRNIWYTPKHSLWSECCVFQIPSKILFIMDSVTDLSLFLSWGWLNLVSQCPSGSPASVKKQAPNSPLRKASVHGYQYLNG